MGTTPDRIPGESDQEGIILEDQGPAGLGGGDPTLLGNIRRVGNRFRFRDGVGLYDPRDISHDVVEPSFDEAFYAAFPPNRLIQVIVWTTPAKTARIRDQTFSYTGPRLTTLTTRQYAEDGATVLFTVTESITYVFPFGNRVASITRTRT